MTEDFSIHSNVTCIPQEDFEKLRGYYYYASHELLKTIHLLKEARRVYHEDGSIKRGTQLEECIFTGEQVEEMLSNLEDLEYRLRKMFVVHEEQIEQLKKRHAEGKMKRGKKEAMTLKPHTRRRK